LAAASSGRVFDERKAEDHDAVDTWYAVTRQTYDEEDHGAVGSLRESWAFPCVDIQAAVRACRAAYCGTDGEDGHADQDEEGRGGLRAAVVAPED